MSLEIQHELVNNPLHIIDFCTCHNPPNAIVLSPNGAIEIEVVSEEKGEADISKIADRNF